MSSRSSARRVEPGILRPRSRRRAPGRRLALTSCDRDRELGGLAAEVAGVVVGERDVDGPLPTGGRADKLLFEARGSDGPEPKRNWSRPSPPSNGVSVEGCRGSRSQRDRRLAAARSTVSRVAKRSRIASSSLVDRRVRGVRLAPTDLESLVGCPASRADAPRSRSRTSAAGRAGRSPTSSWARRPARSRAVDRVTYQLRARCAALHRDGLATEAADHDRRRDLALTEAGDPHLAAELPRGLWSRRSTSSAGTSASTRRATRASSVTLVSDGRPCRETIACACSRGSGGASSRGRSRS